MLARMNPKPFYQSKTIIGAVLMLAPIALQLLGVTASQQELDAAGANAVQIVEGVAGLTGFALVLIGRFKAARPISLSGK